MRLKKAGSMYWILQRVQHIDRAKIVAVCCFNLLKPTGQLVHQQFNIQQL